MQALFRQLGPAFRPYRAAVAWGIACVVLTNLLALGWSVRAADNRFKEGFFTALLSAVTAGLFNATTNNQGTHCFWAIGPPALRVFEGNRSLWRWLLPQICARFEGDVG